MVGRGGLSGEGLVQTAHRVLGRADVGGWSFSVTVKLDGVDRSGDGSAAVAAALLLRLLVAEGLALGEPERFVGFLAPVGIASPLEEKQRR